MSAISDRHDALGGPTGLLGPATGQERPCTDNVGRYRSYQHGVIYWHPDTGAHEVHGAIRDLWGQRGRERSWLGYPTSDEQDLPGGGKESRFVNGRIVWDNNLGARDEHGVDPIVQHDQPVATVQAQLTKLAGTHRVVAIGSRHLGRPPVLHLGTTLTTEPGRPQRACLGTTAAGLQAWLGDPVNAGYHPALVTVSRHPKGTPTFSVIAEEHGPDDALPVWALDRTVTGGWADPGSLENLLAWARDNTYIPASVELYKDAGGTLRVAMVLVPNVSLVPWNHTVVGTTAEVASWSRVYAAYDLVPRLRSRTVDGLTISVWRDDSLGDGWIASWQPPALKPTLGVAAAAIGSRYPVSLAYDDSANQTTTIWAHRSTPLRDQWSATGVEVPELTLFDDAVRGYMRTTGVRGGSLAITKGTRLVYARGFTWGPSNYPITQPTSTFAVGSCVKTLTSLAVLQHLGNPQPSGTGTVELTSSVADVLGLTSTPAGFAAATIADFLRHESGFTGPDFNKKTTRDDLAALTQLPYASTTKRDCARLLATTAQESKTYRYANNGYVVLGAVLEALTKTDYLTALRAQLFTPLGAKRLHRNALEYATRARGEVKQHSALFAVGDAIMTPLTTDRTLAGYGDMNPIHGDACGAMSFAMPDLARVLSCLTATSANTVIAPAIRQLACPATGTSVTWYPTTVAGQRVFGHGGGEGNAHAYVSHRVGDDITLAVAFNRGGPGIAHLPPDWDALVATIPKVAGWPSHDLSTTFGLAAGT